MLGLELLNCPEMAVSPQIMQHVVQVESSRQQYAIGVVGGQLVRQPRSLDEAVSTVRMLEARGYNFSLGVAQVNRYNLGKYGLSSYSQAFELCPNLQAGARILAGCFDRHQDWGKAFSCYYSGNAVTGFRHGYVQKVFASIRKAGADGLVPSRAPAIPLLGASSRRALSPAGNITDPTGKDEETSSRISVAAPLNRPEVAPDPAEVGAPMVGQIPETTQAAAVSVTAPPLGPATPATTGLVIQPPAIAPANPRSSPKATPSEGDGAFVF
ncbi:MAG TPA: transglycosylase SLT domain-containing protein [Stenotrophomonas sp.]|jgi:type IV secretion system protein VirB1